MHIQEFVRLSLNGLRHSTAAGSDLSLFLGLQHHDETVRSIALKQLKELLSSHEDQSSLSADDHVVCLSSCVLLLIFSSFSALSVIF